MHFLVKWKGYPTSDNSWEPRENLHADRLIAEYNKKKQEQAKPKKKGVKSRRARTEEIIPSLSHKHHSHLHTCLMSAHSAPVSSVAMDATRSPTPVSAPDNTPASGDNTAVRGAPPVINNEVLELLEEVAATSLQDYESEVPELEYLSEGSDVPLQLGRRTIPIVEIATTVTSTINYEREAEQDDEESEEAPVGYIPNDPLGHMFYPIYVKNPNYRPTRQGQEGRRLHLAPYIKYSPDYTMVFGTNGKGQEIRSTSVYVGRRARSPAHMTPAMWKELEEGAPQEFAVNEALMVEGNPRLHGEINRFRAKRALVDTLEHLRWGAQKQVNDITKELLGMKRDLAECKVRLELANTHQELQDLHRWSFPPIPRPPMRSPTTTPLPPRQGGPAEMPILHDSVRCTRCYRCHSLNHTVKVCPKAQGESCKCKRCGKKGHSKKHCPQQVVGKGEDEDVTPEEDVASLIKSARTLPRMTLEERMDLLVKEEWRPEVCWICGRQGGQHTELECPLYKKCYTCGSTGSFGYVNHHYCKPDNQVHQQFIK